MSSCQSDDDIRTFLGGMGNDAASTQVGSISRIAYDLPTEQERQMADAGRKQVLAFLCRELERRNGDVEEIPQHIRVAKKTLVGRDRQ